MLDPHTAVSDLKNIGPTTAQWLNAIGIYTLADLQEMGVADAYNLIKVQGYNTSLNLLYALHGALTDVSWNRLSPDLKATLKQESEGFQFQDPKING